MDCVETVKKVSSILYIKPGHGKEHLEMTAKIIKKLAQSYNYPVRIAELAAILHDIGLFFGKKHHAEISSLLAKIILRIFCPSLSLKYIQDIAYAIKYHNKINKAPQKTILLKLLVDADTLDLLGVVGIIRAIQDNYKLKLIKGTESYKTIKFYNNRLTTKDRKIKSILQLLLYLKSNFNILNLTISKKMAIRKIKTLNYFIKELKQELKQYEPES